LLFNQIVTLILNMQMLPAKSIMQGALIQCNLYIYKFKL